LNIRNPSANFLKARPIFRLWNSGSRLIDIF
jgi:hypothetical protein